MIDNYDGIANVGAILSGANNNGLHSANAITAMFIATGQDVANVAESSAGIIYSELTPERDLYISTAAAISSSDWVSSHEKYGRNR
jgi:hydroxymethylglutaryl-CoA reductase